MLKITKLVDCVDNMPAIKCCIHICTVPNSLPLRGFTEKTLAKCHAVSISRTQNYKQNNFVLPESVNSVDGYHVSCYRSFTAHVVTKINERAENHAEGIPAKNAVDQKSITMLKHFF